MSNNHCFVIFIGLFVTIYIRANLCVFFFHNLVHISCSVFHFHRMPFWKLWILYTERSLTDFFLFFFIRIFMFCARSCPLILVQYWVCPSLSFLFLFFFRPIELTLAQIGRVCVLFSSLLCNSVFFLFLATVTDQWV